jgi:hypothetical protein
MDMHDDMPPPFSPTGLSSGGTGFTRGARHELSHPESRPNSPLVSPPADRTRFPTSTPPLRPFDPPPHKNSSNVHHHPLPSIPSAAQPQLRLAAHPAQPNQAHDAMSLYSRQPTPMSIRQLDFDPHVAYGGTNFIPTSPASPGRASVFYKCVAIMSAGQTH